MISPSRNSRACAVAASVIAAEIANANSLSACFISCSLLSLGVRFAILRMRVHPVIFSRWHRALACRPRSVLQDPQSRHRGSLPSGPGTVSKTRLRQATRIPVRVVEGIMTVKKTLAVVGSLIPTDFSRRQPKSNACFMREPAAGCIVAKVRKVPLLTSSCAARRTTDTFACSLNVLVFGHFFSFGPVGPTWCTGPNCSCNPSSTTCRQSIRNFTPRKRICPSCQEAHPGKEQPEGWVTL